MIYTVKRIDEDLDFGCEERFEDMPVMAIVTLINSSREEVIVKVEDTMLYERNINEGDKVCFGVNNKLEKIELCALKTSLSMGVRLVFLVLNQRVIFIIFSCEIQKSLHIITDIFSFFPNHTDFNKERRF